MIELEIRVDGNLSGDDEREEETEAFIDDMFTWAEERNIERILKFDLLKWLSQRGHKGFETSVEVFDIP